MIDTFALTVIGIFFLLSFCAGMLGGMIGYWLFNRRGRNE